MTAETALLWGIAVAVLASVALIGFTIGGGRDR